MKLPQRKKIFSIFVLAIFVFSLISNDLILNPPTARAAAAQDSYMRLSRMKASTDPGSVLIVFTTNASDTGTEAKFKITLDSEYVSTTNFDAVAGNWTTSTTGIPGSSTAMPSLSANATDVSGNTITFTTGDLAANTEYAFFITAGIDLNPSASTTIIHTLFSTTSGDATLDTIDVAVPVISDDQIAISASVPPSFTFVFSGNTEALGTLSTGSITSGSGNTITVTTNAANGWLAWALSANAALDSAVSGDSIATTGSIDASPSTLSAGTEGYVLDVDLTTDAASGGTVTIAAEYLGADTSSGGTLSTSFQQIASANGTADGDVITIIPRVAIAGQTSAANDYSDTLTIVGSGIF